MKTFVRGGSLLACLLTAMAAQAATPESTTQGTLSFGARYRHESVDQDNALRNANADTLRLRLGYRTATWHGFSAFAEADYTARLGASHYNDTRNGATGYSVIGDPEGAEINQALLRYASKRVSVQGGRQRLVFDNQRFVGGSAWRQNEQTYDGGWLQWTPLDRFALDYAYIDNINTVFGPDAPTPASTTTAGNIEGRSHLLHAQLKLSPALVLTGYEYRLGLHNIAVAAGAPLGTLSSRTTGLRASGQAKGFSYAAEYARQRDWDDNPWQLDSRYSLLELGYTYKQVQAKVGQERLGAGSGAGNRAFQTPLATKHAFQGWADVFLTTPADGLRDRYVGVTANAGGQWQAWFHDFHDDRNHARLGRELNLSWGHAVPGVKGLDALIKVARYRSRDERRTVDTDKLWLQLDYRY